MAKLYSAQQYTKNMNAFKTYMNKIKLTDDIEKVKERVMEYITTSLFYLEDLILSTVDKSVYQHDKTLLNSFSQTLKLSNSIEELNIISELLETIDTFHDYFGLDESDLLNSAFDLENNQIDEFNKFNESYLLELRKCINNYNSLNMFFPNCFNGYNASKFSIDTDNTFGQTTRNIDQARQNIGRVIKGELKGSLITNNYFDVLFLNPAIGYSEEKDYFGNVAEPKERTAIKTCMKYLRPDGVVFITIPYTRLMQNFALYLSKALSNVQVVKFNNGDDELKRITIIGTKNKSTAISDSDLYNSLKNFNYDKALLVEDLNNIYDIPTEVLTLELFRGSELDVIDVLNATNNNMLDSFLEAQTDPLVDKDQTPLLPFNMGQVGLVLTSGCLDGVIEEMPGINHVIKGMTTKVLTIKEEELEDNKVKNTETINNRVKINVFTADGKYIELG